jgi:hypothetical protein
MYCPVGGGVWELNDLTQLVQGPAAYLFSGLTSWVDPTYQHVIFTDGNLHVRELYCPVNSVLVMGTWVPPKVWNLNDLTQILNTPPATGGALTSWADAHYQHVIYLDGNGHVHEMYCPTGGGIWGHNDLTTMVSGVPAAAASALTSWADPTYLHVIYTDSSGHVHELYRPAG